MWEASSQGMYHRGFGSKQATHLHFMSASRISPNEIWYCQRCGLEHGTFHHCPGCNHVVEAPVSGIICDDLCKYCNQQLHKEMMLSLELGTIAQTRHTTLLRHQIWQSHVKIVSGSGNGNASEKRQSASGGKPSSNKSAKSTGVHMPKSTASNEKSVSKENQRRAELGLPPLEVQKARPIEEIINHHGHQFQRVKDQYGRYEVFCLKCEATWVVLCNVFNH